ncbi:MAG: MoaD/ThiS family protein [Methanomicrobiales archaeon]|nr:MoaD/ThiS family protein [Methanomicrobiales archaeon]
MRVKVRLFAILREYLPKELEMELEGGATVREVLNRLFGMAPALRSELTGEAGVLKEYVIILKNGRNIDFLEGPETVLEEGDAIGIFPPAGGG